MTPEEFTKLVEKKASEIVQLHNRTLPIKAGVIAEAHFKDNFIKGGFVNGGLQKWVPSKRLSSTAKSADKKNKTLLSSSPHLFSEVNHIPSEGEVRIINTVPYAAVHNEGLRAGRGSGFTMPKRQFIGESKELTDKIQNLIETEITKILNS